MAVTSGAGSPRRKRPRGCDFGGDNSGGETPVEALASPLPFAHSLTLRSAVRNFLSAAVADRLRKLLLPMSGPTRLLRNAGGARCGGFGEPTQRALAGESMPTLRAAKD
jgi:hypothetical protein